MSTLSSVCRHPVRTVTPGQTIREAAELMREHHVGALVVVDQENPAEPVGIITDRDIVVAIVALGLNPDLFLIDDMVDRPLTTARAEHGLREGLDLMKAKGVRRLPLLDKAGKLTGVVALDDILAELAQDMSGIAAVVQAEIGSERALRKSRIRERQGTAPRTVRLRT